MGFTHDLAVSMLQSIPGYRAEFQKVFGSEKVDIEKITAALAAFEETLVTPNSRFDQWLMGNDQALPSRNCAAIACLWTLAAWPATMALPPGVTPSNAWGWWKSTRATIRLRAALM